MTKSAGRLLIPLCLSLMLWVAPAARADTIISTEGPTGTTLGLSPNSQGGIISFTLGQSYSGVQIYATLENSGSPSGGMLDAYLTTQIGVGTTPADQVASDTFLLGAGAGDQNALVMSLANLAAGTYYLTLIGANQTFGWSQTSSPANFAAPGSSLGVNRVVFPDGGYPPGSPNEHDISPALEYQVVAVPAPEPASALLLGFGLLALLPLWRRRIGYRADSEIAA